MSGAASVSPPHVEEFRAWTRPAGARAARIDISGIAVEFEGLPGPLADRMSVVYAPFIGPPTGAGRPLRLRMYEAPVEYFVRPGYRQGAWEEVYRMHTALEDGVFRTVSYRLASWIDVGRREGALALATGELDPPPRALENFLRSSVAWLTLDAEGFFLHGASIVRRGRAYIFYGPSGAGKSTLAAMNTEGEVISDDLTLVLRKPEGLVAAGGPFRGTYRHGAPVVGTYPVAAFYRLRKDKAGEVRPDDGGCFADLLGNLPFVVDQMPRYPHLIDRVRSLVSDARFGYLHFSKDEDFWPAIDARA
ncbi:MAG TPA: hypothetical protein VEW47_11520 [Candidatus Dormibacteraeota bacterium]|nr:hypothetical protein [Candidatus Dormibacteraeota bacterium]